MKRNHANMFCGGSCGGGYTRSITLLCELIFWHAMSENKIDSQHT